MTEAADAGEVILHYAFHRKTGKIPWSCRLCREEVDGL